MAKNRIFYIVLLIVMGGVYIYTNTYYALLLLVITVIVPLISLIFMILSARGLEITLNVPPTCDKQRAVFTYLIDNNSLFPLAQVNFTIRLENQLTGTVREKKVSASACGRDRVEARLELLRSCVGLITISTKKIQIFDGLGLFRMRIGSIPDGEAVVYPNLEDISIMMGSPIETSGESSRYAPEKPGNDVSEVFSIREYGQGDEIRRIHWKLSSKIDKMMIRDFSLPLSYSVFLMMDMVRGNERLIDTTVELFLSTSKGLLEQGINHNLAWYDAAEDTFVVKEAGSFEEVEMATATLLESYAGTNPAAAIRAYMQSPYRNDKSKLIYITAKPDAEKIMEASVMQEVKTICIYDDKEIHNAGDDLQGLDVLEVSTSDIKEAVTLWI